MPIIVVCPTCGTRLSAPNDAVGKKVRCPKPGCGTLADVVVPIIDAVPVPKPKPKPVPDDDEDDEDEKPRKKAKESRDDDDDDDDRPRKKRRRDDDDEPRPRRRKKRKKASGMNPGVLIVVVFGGLLLLGGVGYGIYALVGGGSLFTRKTPPPASWKQYTYESDGFKAFFPKEPRVMTYPVGIGGPGGFGGGGFGGAGPFPVEDVGDIESFSTYGSGERSDGVHVELWVIRYRVKVPASARDRIDRVRIGQNSRAESKKIHWLGYDAIQLVTPTGMIQAVYTDRFMYMATVTGLNGSRAKSEEEEAFFDNVERVK